MNHRGGRIQCPARPGNRPPFFRAPKRKIVADADRTLEQTLQRTEEAADGLRRSAAQVVSRAKSLTRAAQTGNLAAVRRGWEQVREEFRALQERVNDEEARWPLSEEEERRVFEEDYAAELRARAAEQGLQLHERDGLLVCYPSLVRVLPAKSAVRVDRKQVSTIRPSWLVGLLLQSQQKSSGYASARFLESLYSVYAELRSGPSGRLPLRSDVVPLARIYRVLTALPGASRDYDRTDFARDLYKLDSEGPPQTKSGALVSFPASTGTRGRTTDRFPFVGPDGDVVEYYGVRFEQARE